MPAKRPARKRGKLVKMDVETLAHLLFTRRIDQCEMYELSWNVAGSTMQGHFRELAKMVKELADKGKL